MLCVEGGVGRGRRGTAALLRTKGAATTAAGGGVRLLLKFTRNILTSASWVSSVQRSFSVETAPMEAAH